MILKKQKNNERGAALLIAIVMIFMLSLMGVSAMKGSALERRMASNSVQSAAAFQAAESLTDIALDNEANLDAAWRIQPGVYTVPSIDLKNSFVAAQGVETEFIGDGLPIGYSLAVGNGSSFSAFNYEIKGATVMEGTRTASAVTQGAFRIVPSL